MGGIYAVLWLLIMPLEGCVGRIVASIFTMPIQRLCSHYHGHMFICLSESCVSCVMAIIMCASRTIMPAVSWLLLCTSRKAVCGPYGARMTYALVKAVWGV